jgi:two-component system, NtrC family, response regulator AtoC
VKPLLLVLCVVRHAETRSQVKAVLGEAGHRVIELEDHSQARSLLGSGLNPDLVLLEATAQGPAAKLEYLELLKLAGQVNVCLIAGAGEERLCKEAREFGVRRCMMRPVTQGDIRSMVDELNSAPAHGSGEGLVHSPAKSGESPRGLSPELAAAPLIEELDDNLYFLAASPAMTEIHRQAMLLAEIDAPVLILGESGAGKEVVAQLIHKHSRRSRQKFLKVNCAALPVELLESELFGYRQGAFTGATRDRAGRFEQANRGTLLLDEIGEMSPQMQAKLLHVLQDGQFTRLGGQYSTQVDARVLAATNVDMETALREKTFREDLYYRLNAFTIHVPPLRERREEIPFLIEETIRRAPAGIGSGGGFRFISRLLDSAIVFDWPGNLRELRNFVIRTIILRDQDAAVRELEAKIAAHHALRSADTREPAQLYRPGMRSVVRDLKDRTEAQMIQQALDAYGWNRRRAAQHLNISYRAMLYKIQQHRLAPKLARGKIEPLRSGYSERNSAN